MVWRASKARDERMLAEWLGDQFGYVLEYLGDPVAYGEVWVNFASQDTELAQRNLASCSVV